MRRRQQELDGPRRALAVSREMAGGSATAAACLIETLRQELATSREREAHLVRERDEMRAESLRSIAQLGAMRSSWLQAEEALRELRRENASLRAAIEELQRSSAGLADRCAGLERLIDEELVSRERTEEELAGLQAQAAELRQILSLQELLSSNR